MLEQILDNSPKGRCLNIVLVSEGFTERELAGFRSHADSFAKHIAREVWYSPNATPLNIFRLGVASRESTLGLRYACPPAPVDSAFRATFCAVGGHVRYLAGDRDLVEQAVLEAFGKADAICVIVNAAYGGGSSRENVAWTSISPGWHAGLLHELGHALFALADEYSEREYQIEQPEPSAPNVTLETDRTKLKWRHLVLDETPIPTQTNPDPTRSDYRPSPVAADVVGLFEGAGGYHSRMFRAQYRCRMRSTSAPFCRVCVEAIVKRFAAAREKPEPQPWPTEDESLAAALKPLIARCGIVIDAIHDVREKLQKLAEDRKVIRGVEGDPKAERVG